MLVNEVTRRVFEIEMVYQIGFSFMFMGHLTGQSGTYQCTVPF